MYDYEDCEDFYGEPSEFEKQIEDFKDALMKSVKQEYLDEMERLRKEKAELRDIKEKMQDIEREKKAAIRDLEIEKRNAKRDAERQRFNELMRGFCATGYRVEVSYTQRPKCEKCNESRKITFFSPSGRELEEDCECARKIRHYKPKQVSLFKFTVDRKGLGDVYFERTREKNDHDIYECIADLYELEGKKEFADLWVYCAVFLEESNCQAYCDWLSEQKK